jgi:hypothetical protein
MRRTHAAEMADQISFLKDHSHQLGLAKKKLKKTERKKAGKLNNRRTDSKIRRPSTTANHKRVPKA